MTYRKYLAYFAYPDISEEDVPKYQSLTRGVSKFIGEKHKNILEALDKITDDSHYLLYKYRKDIFLQKILNNPGMYSPQEVILLGYLPIFLKNMNADMEIAVHSLMLTNEYEIYVKELLLKLLNREIYTWKDLKDDLWSYLSQRIGSCLQVIFKILLRALLLLNMRILICLGEFLPDDMEIPCDIYNNFLIEYKNTPEIRHTILTGMTTINQTLFMSIKSRKSYNDYDTMLCQHIRERLSFLPDNMHIGIIMDGNRRWGALHNLPGHFFGTQKAEELLRWLIRIENINEVTLYCLSMDNIKKRDKDEIETLEQLLRIYVSHLLALAAELAKEYEIKVIGERENLSDQSKELIMKLEHEYNRGKRRLNLAIAYDPIRDAQNYNLGCKTLRSDIDYVIRCGDVMRTSGFFPLHTLYSEWIFLSIMWPDMTFHQLIECLQIYATRIRRFGS